MGGGEELVTAGDPLLDEVDEARARLDVQVEVGRGGERVVVRHRAGRGAGADDADLPVAGGGGGAAGGREDHLDDGYVVALAGVAQHRGAGGVARDDECLDALLVEVVEALEGVLAHLADRLLAVGLAGGVAEVDHRLVRELVDHRARDGQAAEPGVEDADGGVGARRAGGRHRQQARRWTGHRSRHPPRRPRHTGGRGLGSGGASAFRPRVRARLQQHRPRRAPRPPPRWRPATSHRSERRSLDDPITSVLAISIDGLNPDALEQLGADDTPHLHDLHGERRLDAQRAHRARADDHAAQPHRHGHRASHRGRHRRPRRDVERRPPPTADGAGGCGQAHRVGLHLRPRRRRQHRALRQQDQVHAVEAQLAASIDTTRIRLDNAILARSVRRDIVDHTRAFRFVHLSLPDAVGHEKGFMSKPYLRAVERVDALVGEIVGAVRVRPAAVGQHRDHPHQRPRRPGQGPLRRHQAGQLPRRLHGGRTRRRRRAPTSTTSTPTTTATPAPGARPTARRPARAQRRPGEPRPRPARPRRGPRK